MSDKDRDERLGLTGLTPEAREARLREREGALAEAVARAKAELEAKRKAARNKQSR